MSWWVLTLSACDCLQPLNKAKLEDLVQPQVGEGAAGRGAHDERRGARKEGPGADVLSCCCVGRSVGR